MGRPKLENIVKKTMNFREGDFEKIAQIFPGKEPSTMIRKIVSSFIDKHYATVGKTPDVNINLD